MKLNGIFGTGSGKVGASVWAVNSGVQIVRPYNPNVSNPNTDAQVEQRAKLKLMSQIAAALAPSIAFKKNGLVSARNQFISANIKQCEFIEGKAICHLDMLTLTGSSLAFPAVLAGDVQAGQLPVSIDTGVAADVNAVVYVAAKVNAERKLELINIKVVNTPGENRTFPSSIAVSGGDVAVYAYGVKYNGSANESRYNDYIASLDSVSATLQIVNLFKMSGATFTHTSFVLVG